MHSDYPPHETIRERLLRDRRNIDALLAGHLDGDPEPPELILERLPSGEYAWVKPDRYVFTDLGRAALAEAELADRCAPTVGVSE